MVDEVSADDIELAHNLVSRAADVALPYVGGTIRYRAKHDGSPVSDADLAAEHAMLELLASRRPQDGVLSEESGQVSSGRRRWLLDPIDGTVQFVAGGPEWGTHVALEIDGEIVLGVITRPLRQRRWWAAKGHGAFADIDDAPVARATRLSVTTTSDLAKTTIGLYRAHDSEVPHVLASYGASTVTHGSHILDLIEGRLDAIVSDRCGFAWDHAPAVVLAVESGGRFSDPCGGVRTDLQGGVYSNGYLHHELQDLLREASIDLEGDMT